MRRYVDYAFGMADSLLCSALALFLLSDVSHCFMPWGSCCYLCNRAIYVTFMRLCAFGLGLH